MLLSSLPFCFCYIELWVAPFCWDGFTSLFSSAYLEILAKQEQKHQTEEEKTVVHLSLSWFEAQSMKNGGHLGNATQAFPGLLSQASLVSQWSWLLFLCVKEIVLPLRAWAEL